MEKTFKRLLSFAVALVMILGMIPVTQIEAKAAETATEQTQPETNAQSAAQIDETQESTVNPYAGVLDADATGTLNAYCPKCQADVDWTPITTAKIPAINSKVHYYVPQNKNAEGQIMGVVNETVNDKKGTNGATGVTTTAAFFMYLLTKDAKVCVHLNGSTLVTKYVAWVGSTGAELNIMGDGTWSGGYEGTPGQTWRATTIHNHSAGTVNLYAGTYTSNNSYNTNADINGTLGHAVVTNGMNSLGKVNIYDGVVIDGDVFCRTGTTTMYGGTIDGRVIACADTDLTGSGTTDKPYYYNHMAPTFVMEGGTINGNVDADGIAWLSKYDISNGGAIVASGATITINGGTINGVGTEEAPFAGNGGAIYAKDYSVAMTKAGKEDKVWKSDYSPNRNLNATVTINGGTINSGVVKGGNGGAICVENVVNASKESGFPAEVYPSLTIAGGTITGGKAIPNVVYTPASEGVTESTVAVGGLGGNIYAYDATVTVGSATAGAATATITLGEAYQGGNVFYDEDKGSKPITIYNNAVISYGKALPFSDSEGHSVTKTVGGNVRADYTTTVFGELAYGEAQDGVAGNLYVNGASLSCKEGANIHHGTARIAGNIYNSWKCHIEAGAMVADGTAENAGNIYYEDSAAHTASNNSGTENRNQFNIRGTVTRGTATIGNGGNIYSNHLNMNVSVYGSVTDGKAANRGGNIWVTTECANGTVNVEGVVSGGEAAHGGNIYARNINIKAAGKVSGGKATENGANLYVCAYGVSYVYGEVDGALEGDVANSASGGTLYVAGTGKAHVYGTLKNGKTTSSGGNVAANNGDVYVYAGAVITGGKSASGGNFYFGAGGGLWITGGTISYGQATNNGGNIYIGGNRNDDKNVAVEASHLTVENATIEYGQAKIGGNVNVSSTVLADTVSFTNTIIRNGIATGGDKAYEGGGNLYLARRQYTFDSCTISGGNSNNKNGGSLTLTQAAQATLTNTSITGGTTSEYGANLYITGGHAVLNNCTINGGSGKSSMYAAYVVEGEKDIPTLTINGGTYGTMEEKENTILYTCAGYGFDKIVINDATVYGNCAVDKAASYANIEIYHGQFTIDPTSLVKGDAKAALQTNGMWGVHVPGEGTANPAPSCTEAGQTDWTCTYTYTVGETAYDCDGYSVAEGKVAHNFKAETVDTEYLATEADHKNAATYYYSCTECGAKGTETFSNGEPVAHEFKDVVADDFLATPADHKNAATYYKSCECGEKSTETFVSGDPVPHEFKEVVADDFLATPADHKNAATYFKSCECGEKSTETFVSGDPVPHEFKEVVSEETLKAPATCTELAVYYKSCECGEKSEETFTYGELAAHTLEAVPAKPATATEEGYEAHYACSCGALFADEKGEEPIEAPTVIAKLPVAAEVPEVEDIVGEDEQVLTEEQKEIIQQIVAQSEQIKKAENLPENTYLKISLSSAKVDGEKVTRVTYKVKPIVNGQEESNPGKKITFYLPVPKDVVKETVAVFHNGVLMGDDFVVQTEGEEKFVIVESDNFSEFTIDVNYVVNAMVGETPYGTLEEALEAAYENNGGVVVLEKPVSVAGLDVPANVTLDLNGQVLTVTGEGYVRVTFNESYIMDSSENKAGRLVVDVSRLRLMNTNKYLPVDMGNGIMFVEAVSGQGKNYKADSVYQCWMGDDTDVALMEALKTTDASVLGLKFQVIVSWGTTKLKYTFSNETVKAYAQNWTKLAMYLKLVGAEGIDDLTYQARIVFAEGTEAEVLVWSGAEIPHHSN